MPRRKYNPEGNNDYSSPHHKPPRHDLRQKHKKLEKDPLDIKDEKDMKLSEEIEVTKISDAEAVKLAKKIALKKIRTAGEIKHLKDDSGLDANRQHVAGFPLNEDGMKALASTYKYLGECFYNIVKANNIFTKIKSSQISPDGRLGGAGYIKEIRGIRSKLSDTVNVVSDLLDTFYDEINSPHWKKQVEEKDNIKDIIEDADDIIDRAEEGLEENIEQNQEILS